MNFSEPADPARMDEGKEAELSSALTALVAAAVVMSGISAGIGADRLIVQYPARLKIGSVAYTDYARVSDLANGVAFYALISFGGLVLNVAALVVAVTEEASSSLLWALSLAVGSAVGVLVCTAFAAPTLFKAARCERDESVAGPLLDRFIRFAKVRGVLLMAEFGFLIWAVLELQ